MNTPLSWAELTTLAADRYTPGDRINGETNSQSRLRLFGQAEAAVRVTLYRDRHAWCPYCQKVWLWLEEMQIPYRIEKVTMFCYGEKEDWYKRKVRSGMLPAIELDGRIITESDDILIALEREFGVLGWGMTDPRVVPLRQLERLLFRLWCMWLCRPASSVREASPLGNREEEYNRSQFIQAVRTIEDVLSKTPGDYFLEEFSTVDVIFTPYVERMNASLFYYKGYSLRDEHPRLAAWFDGLERRATYRGTQSDFHTHAHDLPPQMGGCYTNGKPQAIACQHLVDNGSWFELPDAKFTEPATARAEALHRTVKHHANIIRINPAPDAIVDEALRCALTNMMADDARFVPPPGGDAALRYLRDRISVPRDMSIYAAKHLRSALETTAALVGTAAGVPIPFTHRRDQDPANFARAENDL